MQKSKIITLITLLAIGMHYNHALAKKIVELKTPFKGSSIFLPSDSIDNTKKYPAVMIFHGSEGGLDGWVRGQARYLAKYGYATFFYCYFDCNRNASDNKKELHNIELSQILNAIAWFRQARFTKSNIALYGVSRGAELALILASLINKLELLPPQAVLTHAASDIIELGYNPNWSQWMCWQTPNNESKIWDINCGSPYPSDPDSYHAWIFNGNALDFSPYSRIEIENYTGPIFMTHGQKDTLWSVERTQRIENTLIESRILQSNPIMPEVHYFEKQGHYFDMQSEAERWRLMLDFLSRHLK